MVLQHTLLCTEAHHLWVPPASAASEHSRSRTSVLQVRAQHNGKAGPAGVGDVVQGNTPRPCSGSTGQRTGCPHSYHHNPGARTTAVRCHHRYQHRHLRKYQSGHLGFIDLSQERSHWWTDAMLSPLTVLPYTFINRRELALPLKWNSTRLLWSEDQTVISSVNASHSLLPILRKSKGILLRLDNLSSF